MKQTMKWVNGSGTTSCDAGAAAWTQIGGRTVNVCSVFKSLVAQSQAIRAIHETLHGLGLSENPPDSSAMMSAEISNFIGSKCGGGF